MTENNLFIWRMPEGMTKNYFNYQKKWLKFSGVLLDDVEEGYFYKFWSFLVMANYFIMHFLLEPYEAIMHFNDFQALVSCCMYLLTDVLGYVKIIVLYVNRKRVGKMLELIESGVFLPNVKRGGPDEIKWMRDVVLVINRQTVLYAFTAFTTIFIGIFSCLYKRMTLEPEKWDFPYVEFENVAGRKSPYWELGWAYQGFHRSCLAVTLFGIDTIIPGVLAILSIQFQMLQNTLRRLVQTAYIEYTGDEELVMQFPTFMDPVQLPFDIKIIPKEFLYEKLKSTVKYHLDILQITEDMEELFNKLVLTVFLSTLFILCFTMFHASTYPLLHVRVLQDLCYLSFILVQVFCYCYWGNEVTIKSQNVAQAAFDSNFIGSDTLYQKGLALMMQRSQKPVIMTAGKFANLSITTFVSIMRASYSYYMVLTRNKR